MLTLLSEKETVVEKAIFRVLATIAPELKVQPVTWGNNDLGAFQEVTKKSNAALVVNAPGLTAQNIRDLLEAESTITPYSLLLFGSQAPAVACEPVLIERTNHRVAGEKTLRLASLLAAASSATPKRSSTVPFLADCHDLKTRLLREIRNSQTDFATRCTTALQQLDQFINNHDLNLTDGSNISSFFRNLRALLVAGTEHDSDTGTLETEIRSYCEALRTAGSMSRKIGALRGTARTTHSQSWRSEESESSTEAPAPPKVRVSVLIVEDDPVYAQKLVAHFETLSHQIETYEIEFLTHVPHDNETRPAFRARLLKRIQCDSQQPQDEALTRLHAVIMDYAMDSFAGVQPGEADEEYNGIDLAHDIRQWRPGVEVFLLTGKDILEIVEEADSVFARPFWKHDPSRSELDELFRTLVETLRAKYHAPFWEALQEFAKRPVVTYHAMALAHGRSAKKSPVLADFLKFYGDNYFLAETSATVDPLDSLLHPTGSIMKAQERAAHAFGARQTRFVTNGTSTANKIVLQSILQPGDSILIDRNCHISHHYGVVLSGARPYYLNPHSADAYGISGGIPLHPLEDSQDPLDSLTGALKKRIRQRDVPKAILLTNCTFDGIICRPEQIIKAVRQTLKDEASEENNISEDTLREIAFVFDEAWFAYARFHPRFIEFTGMATAARLCEEDDKEFYKKNLRVYVTHSTHKTLSAFRQASMIHIRDPLLETDPVAALRFEEAFLTHTSTSPHSGIIASLDVARRQMELEGCALIDEALKLAEQFREDFGRARRQVAHPSWNRVAQYFDLVEASQLGAKPLISKPHDEPATEEFILDPTKLTLHMKAADGGFDGDELKRHLLAKYNIQINKNSDNTVLLMVNAGATMSSLAFLKEVLIKLAREIEHRATQRFKISPANPHRVPPFSQFDDKNEEQPRQEHNMAAYFHNVHLRMTKGVKWYSLLKVEQELRCEPPVHRISATFVNPYPPGYPILVPGQVIDQDTIEYLNHLTTKEIHGTRKNQDQELELLVFKTPNED